MATFRKQYRQTTGVAATIIRVVLMLGILLVMLFMFDVLRRPVPAEVPVPIPAPDFLPLSSTGRVVYDHGVWISIDERYLQPEWVAYRLNREQPRVTRKDELEGHYLASGLVPDCHEQETVGRHSSMLSSPIYPEAWRQVNDQLCLWAAERDSLYVMAGPILNLYMADTISVYKKPVPLSFFLVVAEATSSSVAFIIPNTRAAVKLRDCAVSIDEVEKQTGINFFPKLNDFTPESVNHVDLWINQERYDQRR
jgi:endonuclease G, mitochondrial